METAARTRMTIGSRDQLKAYAAWVRTEMAAQKKRVLVCAGPGCLANGAEKILDAFRSHSIEAVGTTRTGCHGFCEVGPVVRIEPDGVVYVRVKPEDVAEIVEETLRKGRVVRTAVYTCTGVTKSRYWTHTA